LQEENPSRESTIVRTAGKLIPFHFNRIPEIIDGNVPLATRRRQKRYNLKSNESVSSESFCPLCNSPLDKSEMVDWSNHNNCKSSNTFYTSCCSSCQFQILPPDSTSMEKFYTDLPHSVVARANQVNNGKLDALRWVFVSCHGQVNTFQIW
jgi:cytoplasmic tRNA 2-thiolation protein 2